MLREATVLGTEYLGVPFLYSSRLVYCLCGEPLIQLLVDLQTDQNEGDLERVRGRSEVPEGVVLL